MATHRIVYMGNFIPYLENFLPVNTQTFLPLTPLCLNTSVNLFTLKFEIPHPVYTP